MTHVEFIEQVTFGQGAHGQRCRICLADDYAADLVHESWCELIRARITERVMFPKKERKKITVGELRAALDGVDGDAEVHVWIDDSGDSHPVSEVAYYPDEGDVAKFFAIDAYTDDDL